MWYTSGMQTEEQSEFLAQALQEHRERLLRLAERHLNPVLRRRVSPEDVLQEAAAAAYRWGGDFIHNQNLHTAYYTSFHFRPRRRHSAECRRQNKWGQLRYDIPRNVGADELKPARARTRQDGL